MQARRHRQPRAACAAIAIALALAVTSSLAGCGNAQVGTGSTSGTTATTVRTGNTSAASKGEGGSSGASGIEPAPPVCATVATEPATSPDAAVSCIVDPAPPGQGGDSGGGSGGNTGSPPVVCEPAPASTAVGLPGGGELVCSSPGFPGTGDTLFPDTTIPQVQPDAQHGVVTGSSGGSACPKTAEVCNAMFRIVGGTITATPADASQAKVTTEVDPQMGYFAIKLTPGTWTLALAPDPASECDPTTVTVIAGEEINAGISCWPKA